MHSFSPKFKKSISFLRLFDKTKGTYGGKSQSYRFYDNFFDFSSKYDVWRLFFNARKCNRHFDPVSTYVLN